MRCVNSSALSHNVYGMSYANSFWYYWFGVNTHFTWVHSFKKSDGYGFRILQKGGP
jgi:hypothetical protein